MTIDLPSLRSQRIRILFLGCFTLLLATAHAQSPNWQLTWSDEFNAASGTPADPAKWNIVTGGKGFGIAVRLRKMLGTRRGYAAAAVDTACALVHDPVPAASRRGRTRQVVCRHAFWRQAVIDR